jgi:hypothetical protein
MEVAQANPDSWAVGFLEECWWSRLALPTLNSWSEQGKPLRLLQKSVAKDDPEPKALSCYGLYVPQLDQTWIRFVDGRPISSKQRNSFRGACKSSKRRERKLWSSSGTTLLGTSPKRSGAGSEDTTAMSKRVEKE